MAFPVNGDERAIVAIGDERERLRDREREREEMLMKLFDDLSMQNMMVLFL